MAQKNIFCGSLRHLNESLFDAILVLEPDMLKPFISLSVSAMPISQKTLAVHGEVWHAEHPEIQQKIMDDADWWGRCRSRLPG